MSNVKSEFGAELLDLAPLYAGLYLGPIGYVVTKKLKKQVKKVPSADRATVILESVVEKAGDVKATIKDLTPLVDKKDELNIARKKADAKVEAAIKKVAVAKKEIKSLTNKLNEDIKKLQAEGKLLPTTSKLVPKQ